MDEDKGWLRESWRTVVLLALIFGVALFLRVYFVADLSFPAGYYSGKGDYSGGSDPFYWERALLYSFETGKEISIDRAMNYPIGFPNVRPPLFPWFNLLVGYLIAPLIGNAWDAAVFMLLVNSALFGALTIVPTYLLGKEAFSRRVGLIAALLLALSAAAVQRSRATISVHDSWTLFFVVCAFYFYLRSLKTLQRRRWVENWSQGASIAAGLRSFLHENNKSVLYSLLAGLSVAVTALSWQGWAYVPVILVITFAVEVLLDRIRNQDVMGVMILFTVILGTPLLISLPWYYVRGLIRVWWDVPFYLFLVAVVLGIVFTVARDYPWTLVIPATVLAGSVGLAIGFSLNPALLYAFVSGAGYFIKNKVYQTIAEAQEPGLSELQLSFGWFTFYIGLAAIGFMIWQTPRRNNPAFTMLVLWTLVALFMALSAARFIFNASPPFVIAVAYALDFLLVKMDFAGMRRTYRSLREGSLRNAIRKAVRIRHILTVLFIAFLVLLPNTWWAVDAAIPFERKGQYDAQINNALPPFLRAPGFQQAAGRSTFYLGAFGYSLPNETEYFPAAYRWLLDQDADAPLEQRPAVMAWWDYGFELAERGGHPVVADPFQNGYAIAGQFILAQNESSAIALMTIRLWEGDFLNHGRNLSPEVRDVLARFGLNAEEIRGAYANPYALIPVVRDNPAIYGPWDNEIQPANALYIYLNRLLTTRFAMDRLVDLYRDTRQATGWEISYFMVDARLFPISAQNTGIFYAPVKLSDHRVINLPTGQVMPVDFWQIYADTNRGSRLPIQIVGPADQIRSTTIEYKDMFYNSMFYRAYIGYSPADLGSTDKGIPGFSQALQGTSPMPAWNLTHWRVVYRTAYYNPYPDPANHTTAWRAMNYDEALELQKRIQEGKATGVVDLSAQASVTNGVVMLRYYDGVYVNGTVSAGGVPIPGAYVTASDELGTPHYFTKTDAQGRYSVLAPFGNVTISVTTGNLTKRTLLGAQSLTSLTFPITYRQAMRAPDDLDGDSIPDWLLTKNLEVPSQTLRGTVYYDLAADGTYGPGDLAVPGATVSLQSAALPGYSVTFTADARGAYSSGPLFQGTYRVNATVGGRTVALPDLFVGPSTDLRRDLAIPFVQIQGTTRRSDGSPVAGATVELRDPETGQTMTATSSAQGEYVIRPVLAGNYLLEGRAGDLGVLPLPITAGSQSLARNLTLEPSGRVVGTTYLFGTVLPFATLQFQSVDRPFLVRTITSGADGSFEIFLPAGEWDVNGRVYQGIALYATLGRVTVGTGETTTYDPMFAPGARIGGTLRRAGTAGDLGAQVYFLRSNAEWWLRAGPDNGYLVFLPVGTYSLQAWDDAAAYIGTLVASGSMTRDLDLQDATTLKGTVFWDMDGNGLADQGEGVSGARIEVTDDLGRRGLAVTNDTGAFALPGFSNRTYQGTISADAFQALPLGPATFESFGPQTRFALTPIPVQVSGTVLLNGTILVGRSVHIQARALGDGARLGNTTSESDGTYSLSLSPGRYALVVDENVTAGSEEWRYQNLRPDEIALDLGTEAFSHDLVLAARTLVIGNVTLNGSPSPAMVEFSGPDNVTLDVTEMTFRVYLQPGNYTAFASRTVAGSDYVVLESLTLPLPGNLSLALGPATKVTGSITYNGESVNAALPLEFVRREGGSVRVTSNAIGAYTVSLTPGNYTVSLEGVGPLKMGEVLRYYRYTFLGNLTVPNGTASLVYDLEADRALDNTTVSGRVSYLGVGLDATLTFYARGGGALDGMAVAGPDGTYEVGLSPGTYDVYALRELGGAAFLGSVEVPREAHFSFNVTMARAFLLFGVTTGPTGQVQANLTIQGAAQGAAQLRLDTDASGTYSVLLPQGAYTVFASTSSLERSVRVQYAATEEVDLATDQVLNLALTKVVRHGVTLSWDASQRRTIRPGDSVAYTIAIRNTGNDADTYTLGAALQGWSFRFSPSTVSLNFGDRENETTVRVVIQSPPDARVDHGALTITATSSDGTTRGTVNVLVDIAQVRSIGLRVDPASGTFDGRYLNYTVILQNRGNAKETVTVMITNPQDLTAAGWVPLVGEVGRVPAGPTFSGVDVEANATTSLRLSLRSEGGASGVTVVLQAVASDTPMVSAQTTFTANLPQLAPTGPVGVSGPQILRSLPPNELLIAIVAGLVSAVATGLFLTRRRR